MVDPEIEEGNRTHTPNTQKLTPHAFFEAWSELRGSLPKVLKTTSGRMKRLNARIKDGLSLEEFREAIVICASTPFLRGEGPRGWKADFDWLIENDTNVARVREGKYGGAATSPIASHASASIPRYVDPDTLYSGPEYETRDHSRGAA